MKWRALVLGGGGALGEFQIGALDIISQQYDSFDFYLGLGGGSLHSTLLAQYDTVREGYEVLLDVWDNIRKTGDILDEPMLGEGLGFLGAMMTNKSWGKQSVFGNTKLKGIIRQHIDWNILGPRNNWGIQATSLTDGQVYTITNSPALLKADVNPDRQLSFSLTPGDPYDINPKIYDLILGAGCVPAMLPPVDIFDHRFAEGAVRHFLPLQLAVLAFANARTSVYDEAEFVVVNNYLNEPEAEDKPLLDTGLEVAMRAIKLMVMELGLHDLEEGRAMLESLGAPRSKITVIAPGEDFRLSPMDFNDTALRAKTRQHGVSRAALLLGVPPAAPVNGDAIRTAHESLLEAEPHPDALSVVLQHQISNPDGAYQLRESIAAHPDVPVAAPKPPATEQAIGCAVPTDLEELIDVMNAAHAKGQKLKAIGADYAFSQILGTSGVQIDMHLLNDIYPPDNAILRNPAQAVELIEFEAGATIGQLTSALWQQGKALINQPGSEKLSFVGVASCGGHGSGIRLGPLADEICSMQLLTFQNGTLVRLRIEPTHGITDPAKFNRPGMTLLQDDETFQACKVSMGCMGIIYSVIVRTQNRFYLQELRTMEKWSAVRDLLPSKLKDTGIHSIHVWLNPYPIDGEHHCVLTEYRRAEGPSSGRRGMGATFMWDRQLAPLFLWIMKNFPRHLGAVIDSSLKLMVDAGPVVMPCFEALNFGSPNEVHVEATNCGVPSADVTSVVDTMFALFEQRTAEGAYITCPPGLRFVAATDSHLSAQYGRDTSMIELPLVYGTAKSTETLSAFQDTLRTEWQGRPHWGQRLSATLDAAAVREMYPDSYPAFKRVFQKLSPDKVFDNIFTELLGLRDVLPQLADVLVPGVPASGPGLETTAPAAETPAAAAPSTSVTSGTLPAVLDEGMTG